MFDNLFKLRGQLSSVQRLVLGITGLLFILLVWSLLTMGEQPIANTSILPKPGDVWTAFGQLYTENDLIVNLTKSISLNLAGYIEAILISLVVGFTVGLWPFFRGNFQPHVDAFRYVPLTGVTGVFIAAYGLGTDMKVHFLAFGIMIYMLPVVVQRIDEVKSVFLKTTYTIGATDWQTIRTVYVPSVLSRFIDDIRVLTAISWTYIIIAESLGNQGGIGALIWRVGQRQGRIDKVFALLLIIILIGIVQDRIFVWLDKYFFPHKYQATSKYAPEKKATIFSMIWTYVSSISGFILLGIYVLGLIAEFVPIAGGQGYLTYFFGETCWVVHIIAWTIIMYLAYNYYHKSKYPYLYSKAV